MDFKSWLLNENEQKFLDAIKSSNDKGSWLIFADWLEEQGDSRRAELIRLVANREDPLQVRKLAKPIENTDFWKLLSHIKLVSNMEIFGRRWFQRTYGNTYNTAEIIIDGKTVHKTPRQYGYGDHYMTVASDWLEENGYMPGREHYENGGSEAAWRYFRDERGIPFLYHAIDVRRQGDL